MLGEFMAIYVSIHSIRFGVVSRIAMVASEECTEGLEVGCVRFVVEGDHDWAMFYVLYRFACDLQRVVVGLSSLFHVLSLRKSLRVSLLETLLLPDRCGCRNYLTYFCVGLCMRCLCG